jgi:hypothetical protein
MNPEKTASRPSLSIDCTPSLGKCTDESNEEGKIGEIKTTKSNFEDISVSK